MVKWLNGLMSGWLYGQKGKIGSVWVGNSIPLGLIWLLEHLQCSAKISEVYVEGLREMESCDSWQSPKWWWWWWWCKIMATCRRLALPEMQRATMVLLQTCSPWKYEFYLFQYVYISLGVVTIQQMIFVCIISRVNLKTRPDIAISFGPETWNSPFTFPTFKEENFENIIKVLTTSNLLRGKRL